MGSFLSKKRKIHWNELVCEEDFVFIGTTIYKSHKNSGEVIQLQCYGEALTKF